MATVREALPGCASAPQEAEGKEAMKVVIAGGGTGGHLYIGVAVAKELQRRAPDHEVIFVGAHRSLEARIVPNEGFRLEFISSAGLKGVGALRLLRNLMLIPRGLRQSRRLLLQHLPDVVVGVGGYSSGPVVLAGWWLGKPTLIIEPNAFPGLANRWLGRVADRVAVALPETARYFGAKAVVTGIPVRPEFSRVTRREHGRGRLTVLIYGGSQGSHALNTVVCDALEGLKALGPGLHIIHQTGERDHEAVRAAYRRAGVRWEARAFLPRIYEEFERADLIVARAGAGTIAEITAAGKAALLVPFPQAADDHQTRNARALEEHGAARLIPQSELDAERLVCEIRRYLEHPEETRSMEDAARRLAKPDAAGKIVDLILELGAARIARTASRN